MVRGSTIASSAAPGPWPSTCTADRGTIYNGGCEMAELAREYPLVLYDQRGGGRSDLVSDAARLTWRHHVDDLNAVLEHVGGSVSRSSASPGELAWRLCMPILILKEVSRLLLIAPMPVAKLPFARERGDAIRRAAGPARMTLRSELETKQQAAKSDEEVVGLPANSHGSAAAVHGRRCQAASIAEWLRLSRIRYQEPGVRFPRHNDFHGRLGLPTHARSPRTRAGDRGQANQSTVELNDRVGASRTEGRLLLFESAGHDVPLDQPRALLTAAREFLRGGNPQGAVRPSP